MSLSSRAVTRAMVVAAAGAVFVFSISLRNSIPFGPGPDPFDYISTARHLLQDGTLLFPIQAPEQLGIDPRFNTFFVPEPFVLAPDGRHYVSLYPPGTSFLMAPLILLAGAETGPYWLGPLLGAGCVVMTYLLACAWFERRAAVVAAILVACSPSFLGPARAPLSDIPALFFLLLLLVLLSRRAGGNWTALMAGGAMGFAALIRPNVLVLLPATIMGIWWLGQQSHRRRRLLAFGSGLAPFVMVGGGLNALLYGSPLTTGYALSPGFIRPFALDYFTASFPRWMLALLMSLGPVTLAAAMAGAVRLRDRRVLVALMWVASMVGFYSVYRFSGNVRLHRFLLPCLPILVLLALAGIGRLTSRIPRRSWHQLRPALAHGVLLAGAVANLAVLAPRYALLRPYDADAPALDLGQVARIVGPQAVVFSRVWGGRLQEEHGVTTANWSRSGAIGARSLLLGLLDRGRSVYLLDTETFAERGRWWLGMNTTRIPLPDDKAHLYHVGPPLPGVTVPLRRFVPPGGE